MFTGLLPIGSVVLLKNSTAKVMIIGVCQKAMKDGVIWDYAGCSFPVGYIGADNVYLFNNNSIDSIFFIGYQDEEQFAFKAKADELMSRVRDVSENETN